MQRMLKFYSFRKRDLTALRLKAFRRRVWHKTLNHLERALVNSVIKVVDRVQSALLTKVLSLIVKKLEAAMESKVKRLMRGVGQTLAKKMSLIAESWGNRSAQSWEKDENFIRYLTIIEINMSCSSRY